MDSTDNVSLWAAHKLHGRVLEFTTVVACLSIRRNALVDINHEIPGFVLWNQIMFFPFVLNFLDTVRA